MRTRRSALLAGLMAGVACRSPVASAPPPQAEFLVAAGDSTFWVVSDSAGVRVRASPMLLAHYGARFYELYTIDDDRSFFDAVFIGQRLYRRDLATGDSTLVFADTVVPRLAQAYAAAHPGEAPLSADDDASEDPATVASAELDVTDLHGPYVSFAYRVQVRAGEERAATLVRRGVLDLRTGQRATLSAVFGPGAARRVVASGRRAFAAALDSIAAVRGARPRRAVEAASELAFDTGSFALVDVKREPAVEFVVSGTGEKTRGVHLPLAPIAAPIAAPIGTWWADARDALPASADADLARWLRARYEVVARYDSAGGRATVQLREVASQREWSVGRLPAPVDRIFWLDAPPLDSATRRALSHAFDESLFYSDDARTAARKGGRAGAHVLSASLVSR